MASGLNQCISAKTQNQIDHCDETKKEYSWLIPQCKPELKETTSWTTVGQAKDIASSPNPLVKALCRGRHWVWGPTRRHRVQLKSEAQLSTEVGLITKHAVCRITYGLYLFFYNG